MYIHDEWLLLAPSKKEPEFVKVGLRDRVSLSHQRVRSCEGRGEEQHNIEKNLMARWDGSASLKKWPITDNEMELGLRLRLGLG